MMQRLQGGSPNAGVDETDEPGRRSRREVLKNQRPELAVNFLTGPGSYRQL